VSLSLASVPEGGPEVAGNGDSGNRDAAPSSAAGASAAKPAGLSFEDAFEAELVADLGDLGPGAVEGEGGRGGDRDRDRGNDRRPSRGRSRRR
jgi:hypothetical protein